MDKTAYHTPDSILTEAFERIGLIGTEVTPLQWDSGLRAINYELWEMANGNPQLDFLWRRNLVGINPNQSIYPLDSFILDIKGVNLSSPFNVSGELNKEGQFVNGVPSTGWAGVFKGIESKVLTAGESVSFTFDDLQQILYFKIRGSLTEVTKDITLTISVKSNQTSDKFFYTETFFLDQLYNSNFYFCVQSPVVGKVYTLKADKDIILSELAFLKTNQQSQDRPIGAGSITDYMSMAQKILSNNTPSWYVLKKERVPLLIFPAMNDTYSCVYMLTFGLPFVEHVLLALLPVLPIYALNYLIARVCVNLAKKFNPERLNFLVSDSSLLLQNLTQSQSSQAPVSFRFDFNDYQRG